MNDYDDGRQPEPARAVIDALRREIELLRELLTTQAEADSGLSDQRFESLQRQMANVEKRRVEQKDDTQSAVDAALAAQKEAAGKMEAMVSARIDGLRENFETEIRSIRDMLADLKDRVTQAESLKQGATDQRVERRRVTAGTVAVVGVTATVVLALLTVIGFLVAG